MPIVDFMSIDSETDHELFLFLDCFFRNFKLLHFWSRTFCLNQNIYLASLFVLEEGGAQLIFQCYHKAVLMTLINKHISFCLYCKKRRKYKPL